jgi:chromate transport protein ChrA
VSRRQVLQAGALVWVVAGAAVALGSLGDVNDDARLLVGLASIVGPLLAVGAAVQLGRHANRSAGVLLVLSALATPTYFAYVLNIPALVVGVMLAVGAHRVLSEPAGSSGRRSTEGLKA